MTRPTRSTRTTCLLRLAAMLTAAFALGVIDPADAQQAPTEAGVRDFLENSVVQMQLSDGSHVPFDTDRIEFIPAAALMPHGGVVVTQDVAMSLTMGAPYELLRWTLHEVEGVLSLALVVFQEGEPAFIVEGPISGFDGERLDFGLQGRTAAGEIIDEVVVNGSLIVVARLQPAARSEQHAALAQSWTLQRVGEASVAGDGMPGITYALFPDGDFRISAEGDLIDPATGRAAEPRGRWIVTGTSWGRPPLDETFENERGPLLLLFGADAAPGAFIILGQVGRTLTMRSLSPIPMESGLEWVTVHLEH